MVLMLLMSIVSSFHMFYAIHLVLLFAETPNESFETTTTHTTIQRNPHTKKLPVFLRLHRPYYLRMGSSVYLLICPANGILFILLSRIIVPTYCFYIKEKKPSAVTDFFDLSKPESDSLIVSILWSVLTFSSSGRM